MGFFDWFQKRRKHDAADDFEDAEERAFETDDEREISEDRMGRAADQEAATLLGGGSIESEERLADVPDSVEQSESDLAP